MQGVFRGSAPAGFVQVQGEQGDHEAGESLVRAFSTARPELERNGNWCGLLRTLRACRSGDQRSRAAGRRLHTEPQGVLKLTAPVAFGTLHIAPALPAFLAQYPQIQIDLTISDRFFNAPRKARSSIAGRRELPPNSFTPARGDQSRGLRRAGTFQEARVPATPHDLVQHNCLVYTHANPDSQWPSRR